MSAGFAQVVEQDEAALVYYSPKTVIRMDVTYSVDTYEKGIYAEYAEPMLGTDEAVMASKNVYKLENVHLGTITLTDYSRPHKVVSEPGVPMLLSINEKGLLKGYNLPYAEPASDKKQAPKPHKPEPKKEPSSVVPFSEEVLEAATPLAQAHAVTQQILHLRETRMYLLNGEVEHAPADGKSMQLVLEELDKQERELTELFIGKKSHRMEHKQFFIDPQQESKLWFFSEENGFTDAENIDADTLRVNMKLHQQTLSSADESKKKKKGSELTQIVYNLPGSADIEVLFDGKTMTQRTLPIAQLGVDIPLVKDLFSGKPLPVIVFSEKTGNIQSITK